jgi:hypothetical protein
MASIFIVAGVISVIFLLAKFLEMRFVDKESKPLKLLIRDTLLVYFSVLIANFIMDQIKTTVISGGSHKTLVFTDNPDF